MKIESPLEIYYTKNKKFILNLNQYRNTHFFALSASKRAYKDFLWHDLPKKTFHAPVTLKIDLYPKRKCDLSNVCSVIDKFVCDVLVEKGILKDDSIYEIGKVTYEFKEIDKINPRAEIMLDNVKV